MSPTLKGILVGVNVFFGILNLTVTDPTTANYVVAFFNFAVAGWIFATPTRL